MYASSLMDEVARDLLDEATDDDDRRWPRTDLLEYLNAAEKMTVFLLPTSYTKIIVFQLSSGTRQYLPDGTSSYQDPLGLITLPQAIELVSINRNMGTDGLTAGSAIIPIDMLVMDRMDPSWHTATADDEVEHVIFEPKDRNHFSVYPPQPSSGQGWVESVYSAIPPEIEADLGPSYDADINLDDIYKEPLMHFMKFTAYSKDSASSVNASNRALFHWNMFVTLLGRKDLIEKDYNALMKWMKSNVNGNNTIS